MDLLSSFPNLVFIIHARNFALPPWRQCLQKRRNWHILDGEVPMAMHATPSGEEGLQALGLLKPDVARVFELLRLYLGTERS